MAQNQKGIIIRGWITLLLCLGLAFGGLMPPAWADGATTDNLVEEQDPLTVAMLNVGAIDPGDDQALAAIAHVIVDDLSAPDIVTLVDINPADINLANLNLANSNGDRRLAQPYGNLVRAEQLVVENIYDGLIAAIQAAAGPDYGAVDIPDLGLREDQSRGGDGRVGYLFRRGRLALADGRAGDAKMVTEILMGPHLYPNPGRIAPNASVFSKSFNPLAVEFIFDDQSIFLIGNHWTAKTEQGPNSKRLRQAKIVHGFVAQLLAADSQAKVVVLGDLNDVEFSEPLKAIAGNLLLNLVELLPPSDRYSVKVGDRFQLLDHVLVSPGLLVNTDIQFEILHTQVNTPEAILDHDPLLLRLILP